MWNTTVDFVNVIGVFSPFCNYKTELQFLNLSITPSGEF
jgi:hypothetical protein